MAEGGEKPLSQTAPENQPERQRFVQELGGEQLQAARRGDSKAFGQAGRRRLAQLRLGLLVRFDEEVFRREITPGQVTWSE